MKIKRIILHSVIYIAIGVVAYTIFSTTGNDVVINDNKIIVESPVEGDVIESPLIIKGEATGTWFFEGDAPVVLTDWDGNIIAESYITADGEWMTEEFVPFTGTLEFEKPEFGDSGILILQKDNPTGLPEHDDAFELQVLFK